MHRFDCIHEVKEQKTALILQKLQHKKWDTAVFFLGPAYYASIILSIMGVEHHARSC